jgi:hypothetical protein
VSESLSDASLDLLVALYQWMNKPGSKGFFEERAIPELPDSLPALEVRALLSAATKAGFLHKDGRISTDPNLPNGFFWEFTDTGIAATKSRINEIDRLVEVPVTSFSAFCDLLLVALADHTKQQGTKFDAFDLRAIAGLYSLEFTPSWIERASEVFEKRDWTTISRVLGFGQDGGIHATLTGPGLLEAERLRKTVSTRGYKLPSYPRLDNEENVQTSTVPSAGTAPMFISSDLEASYSVKAVSIPAADRIVQIDDNAPGRLDAIENLHKIEKLLGSGNNELKLTADERMVIVSEIKPLRERLMKKLVRVGEVCNAVTKGSPLVWLLDKAAGHAVGIVITAALAALGLLAKALIG